MAHQQLYSGNIEPKIKQTKTEYKYLCSLIHK